MGFLDKAKQLLGQHDDKVDKGIDKAGEFAKGKFAGHDEHIDKLAEKGRQYTGEGDTTAAPPPEQPPPGQQPPGQQPPGQQPPGQQPPPPPQP